MFIKHKPLTSKRAQQAVQNANVNYIHFETLQAENDPNSYKQLQSQEAKQQDLHYMNAFAYMHSHACMHSHTHTHTHTHTHRKRGGGTENLQAVVYFK